MCGLAPGRGHGRCLGWDREGPDAGTRLLLAGLAGLAGIFICDWAWLVLVEHHRVGDAFLDAARVVATVGPGADHVGDLYSALSALAMLCTIGFTAVFTAGLVDRLIEPRLVGIVGKRTVPRSGHVIVAGMGQVGSRLCSELRALGIKVVGVERDPHAPHAVAASAVSPGTRVVLRAGEQEAIAETRSLLPLGVIRDVTEIVATLVVSHLLEHTAVAVLATSSHLYLEVADGAFQRTTVSRREDCLHLPTPDVALSFRTEQCLKHVDDVGRVVPSV